MPNTGGGGYEEVAAARRGRFRVTSTPQGPPETTLGRFRLMPTCKYDNFPRENIISRQC